MARAKVFVAIAIAAVAVLTARALPARACSGGLAPPVAGIPRVSSTDVSIATSIIVLSPQLPLGLTVTASGAPIPVVAVTSLGSGTDGSTPHTGFWRLETNVSSSGLLTAQTEYVVTVPGNAGVPSEVTRFTTATGYDKLPGVPPALRSVRLWSVRYPVKDINSGNCVFSEYHGFISLDSDPAAVPNTPADSVIHTVHLSPKTGGAEQTFLFTGGTVFVGSQPIDPYPLPLDLWQPELDPRREYCVTIEAFGYGDRARERLMSNQVCAPVTEISAAGAPPSRGGDGGCSLVGGSPVSASTVILEIALALVFFGAIGGSGRGRR